MKTNNPLKQLSAFISQFTVISIAMLCCAFLISSCGDDDDTVALQLLAQPAIELTEVSQTTMTFSWNAVEGARQYGYRVTNQAGAEIDAGVTTATSISLTDLKPVTTYIVMVKAFPEVAGTANASDYSLKEIQTLFYLPIQNRETEYVSCLQANLASVTNRGVINEDRSGADYAEGWYGTITISKFCGVNNNDIVFKVNRDNTITVLNGEGYDDEGRVIVKTGKSASATLSFDKIYIDEKTAVFDGPNRTLTFTAKNNGTGNRLRESTTETITWAEPEE